MRVSRKRFAAGILFAAICVQFCLVPALAADAAPLPLPGAAEETAPPDGQGEDAPLPREEPWPLLDQAELSSLVGEYLKSHGMDETNSSVSFCYTGTGESWSYNGDMYMVGASLYKLPLMMNLAKKVWAGELSQDDILFDMDISYIEMRSLTYSDNEVSEKIILYFYPFRDYRLKLAEIAGIPEEQLPEEYFTANIFSANFMLGALKELYYHTEKYPNVVECLLDANPGEYYRKALDGKYTVAQKYGGGDGYLHTAAIIYTPVPCLVTVMTHHVPNAEYAIAGLGELLADYAVTMTERNEARHAALKDAAAGAVRAEQRARLTSAEAERLRKAEEEEARRRAEAEQAAAERAEQERLAAERAAAEEAAARQRAEEAAPLKIIALVLAVCLAALLGAYFVRRALGGRGRKAPPPPARGNAPGTEDRETADRM